MHNPLHQAAKVYKNLAPRKSIVRAVAIEGRAIRIDVESHVPKYRQIMNSIMEDIEQGVLRIGERMPSINEISEGYYLSRDTVEKAYNELKKKQIIVSSKGKGYYVARSFRGSVTNVLFLVNKLCSYKLEIYNSFVSALGSRARVDLSVYHCDPKLFVQTLEEKAGLYDHYVVMPHFKDPKMNYKDASPEVINALRRIPDNKLLLIDNLVPAFQDSIPSVYQDFKADIYEALHEGLPRLKRYARLILVFPRKTLYPFPSGIREGFQTFAEKFGFDYEVIDQVDPDLKIQRKDAYVVIEEDDLVNLVKQVREKKMTAGTDVGIVSYNDTPLKALLGITVISTDFHVMGETAAYMVAKGKKEIVKNAFSFINRNSI